MTISTFLLSSGQRRGELWRSYHGAHIIIRALVNTSHDADRRYELQPCHDLPCPAPAFSATSSCGLPPRPPHPPLPTTQLQLSPRDQPPAEMPALPRPPVVLPLLDLVLDPPTRPDHRMGTASTILDHPRVHLRGTRTLIAVQRQWDPRTFVEKSSVRLA
jgi:hypothetical protein